MKSELQIRAERAADQFRRSAQKPIVIEFAGVPKAGKTSTLIQVQAFLKRCGFRTEVVNELASVCPIRDKKHANFDIWTACTTLAQILEKTQNPPRMEDPHILFLDRGIFDTICWMSMMQRLARIRAAEGDLVERFLRIADWRRRISGVIVMIASPEDAMKREKGVLPVENGKGSIMNREVLRQIMIKNLECADRLKNEFRIFKIDTSSGETKDNPTRTAEVVVDAVLSLIEEQVREKILALEKAQIEKVFLQRACLPKSEVPALVKLFEDLGTFSPREEVEANSDLIQALPVVVVRNATGDVLRLRRRENSEQNPLHLKIVIWAGGHVRVEDGTNGEAIVQCAIRELGEELRINVDPLDLRPIGALYLDAGGSTSKHVAIAYEWRAATDDVAIALSSVEFFERRGTSLSGSFVDLPNLTQDVEQGRLTELWSGELVKKCLAQSEEAVQCLPSS